MAEAEPSAVRALAEKLIDRVIEFGINGGGPLKGAVPSCKTIATFALRTFEPQRPRAVPV